MIGFEEIENRINEDDFYVYDLKEEIIKKYEKINSIGYFPSNKSYEEQQLWREKKAFNNYIDRINNAKEAIRKLGTSYLDIFETKEKYIYLKRYILFKYQSKENQKLIKYFDCDISFLVYLFYKNKFNYVEDLKVANSYKPEYFDTYFSIQSIWGKFINNIFDKKNGKKGSDFKWQLENFDKITNEIEDKENLKELLEAFNRFAHFYHTIGNIAPCAPGINSPKGFANFCYDRIDLFFKNQVFENWIKWYYGDEVKTPKLSKNPEDNINKFYLQDFLDSKNLGEVKIPIDKDDNVNIVELTNYINNIVNLIKERGEKLKKLNKIM